MGAEAMAAVEHFLPETDLHPIDIVETLAEQAEWEFDRVGEDQIAVAVEGVWRTYSLSLIWSRRDDMLRLISTFELTRRSRAWPSSTACSTSSTTRSGAAASPCGARRRCSPTAAG